MNIPWFVTIWQWPLKQRIGVDIIWSGVPGEEPWRFVKGHPRSRYQLAGDGPIGHTWISADDYGRDLRTIRAQYR